MKDSPTPDGSISDDGDVPEIEKGLRLTGDEVTLEENRGGIATGGGIATECRVCYEQPSEKLNDRSTAIAVEGTSVDRYQCGDPHQETDSIVGDSRSDDLYGMKTLQNDSSNPLR